MEGVGLGAFEDRELGEVKGAGRVEKLQGVKQSSVQRWSRGEQTLCVGYVSSGSRWERPSTLTV